MYNKDIRGISSLSILLIRILKGRTMVPARLKSSSGSSECVQLQFQIISVGSRGMIRVLHGNCESTVSLIGPRSLGKCGKAECGEQMEDLIWRGQ